jgi:hypothetical protein
MGGDDVTIYYKAVQPDGRDFYSGTVDYLTGEAIKAPRTVKGKPSLAEFYLSVATVPTDCTGMRWPCRLLAVEPIGDVWTPNPDIYPNKRACRSLRVVEEWPAHRVFGPQGHKVAGLIERAARLTDDEARRLTAAWGTARNTARNTAWDAAWDTARNTAWDAAWDTARAAAWDAAWAAAGAAAGAAAWAAAGAAAGAAARAAAWDAAWDAAGAAAWALVAADLIPDDQFRVLTGPWIDVIGDPR